MNDWKELKIDDLPPDILTGDYEFMFEAEEIGFVYPRDRANIFDNLIRNNGKYRYRKPDPKQPTHEELADQYYEDESGPFYLNEIGESTSIAVCNTAIAIEEQVKKAFIAGRESAEPPEAL